MATDGGGPTNTCLEEPSRLPGNYGSAILFYGSEFAKLGKMSPVSLVVDSMGSLRQSQHFVWDFSESRLVLQEPSSSA